MPAPVQLRGGTLADLPATLAEREVYIAVDQNPPQMWVGPAGGGAPSQVSGGVSTPYVEPIVVFKQGEVLWSAAGVSIFASQPSTGEYAFGDISGTINFTGADVYVIHVVPGTYEATGIPAAVTANFERTANSAWEIKLYDASGALVDGTFMGFIGRIVTP